MKIGVISDTHGKMHPGVFDLFTGVDHILHAGDIGKMEIITELRSVAPLSAVYGNVDGFPLVSVFPERLVITFEDTKVMMTHILDDRSPAGLRRKLQTAEATDAAVVIYGHTHEARIEVIDNTLLLNPGSAGPARWKTRPSVALLTVVAGKAPSAEILWL